MINYRETNETYNNTYERVVSNRNIATRSAANKSSSNKRSKKRTTALMKRTTFVLCAFVLLVGVICLINNNSVSASSSSEKQVCYRSVMIEQGDSLWSIAEENMSEEWGSVNEYVQAIKNLNNKTDNQINAGAYISIPYYQ